MNRYELKKVDITSTLALIEHPPAPIAAWAFSKAPVILLFFVIAAIGFVLTGPKNRSWGICFFLAWIMYLIIKAWAELTGKFSRPLLKRLETVQARTPIAVTEQIAFVKKALSEIQARRLRRVWTSPPIKDLRTRLIGGILYIWPLVLCTGLVYGWRRYSDSWMSFGIVCAFSLLSACFYYLDLGFSTTSALAESYHRRSRHVRHALYLTLGACLVLGALYIIRISSFNASGLIIRLGPYVLADEHNGAGVIGTFLQPAYFLLVFMPGPCLYPLIIYYNREVPFTVTEGRAIDSRPPLLLLRSFRDHNVGAASMAEQQWPIDRDIGCSRLEALMQEAVDGLGPFISMGDPQRGDFMHSGPLRDYVPENRWQEVVRNWIREASVVFMVVPHSAATKWELRQIVTGGFLHKLILVMPPPPWASLLIRDNLWGEMLECFNNTQEKLLLSDVPICNVRAIAFPTSGVTLLCSDRGTDTAYEITLQLGLYLVLSGRKN